METYRAIVSKRDTRSYRPEPLPDETVRRIRLIDGINVTETNILLKTSKTVF